MNTIEEMFDQCMPEPMSGCWLWMGKLYQKGYGTAYDHRKKKSVRAHRLAYELKNNCSIVPGFQACHKCDVRSCINPDHIFIGTNTENMRDAANKGRVYTKNNHEIITKYGNNPFRPVGAANGSAKMTEVDVREIRRLGAKGLSSTEIRKRFDLSPAAIRAIVSRRNWKYVD